MDGMRILLESQLKKRDSGKSRLGEDSENALQWMHALIVSADAVTVFHSPNQGCLWRFL